MANGVLDVVTIDFNEVCRNIDRDPKIFFNELFPHDKYHWHEQGTYMRVNPMFKIAFPETDEEEQAVEHWVYFTTVLEEMGAGDVTISDALIMLM